MSVCSVVVSFGWDGILNRYFNNMPAGFTFHYYFEFDGGNVTMRHLCSTADEESVYHQLCPNPSCEEGYHERLVCREGVEGGNTA